MQGKQGKWALLESNPSGEKKMTYTQGWTMGDHGASETGWFDATKVSLAVGFIAEIGSEFGSPKIQVASAVASSIINLIGNEFSEESVTDGKDESEYTFEQTFPAGATWQWNMDIEDDCGSCNLNAKVFQSTTGLLDKPCCLPGTFKKGSHPEYGCNGQGVFMCLPDGKQIDDSLTCSNDPPPTVIKIEDYGDSAFVAGFESFLEDRMRQCRDDVPDCTRIAYASQIDIPPKQRVWFFSSCVLEKSDRGFLTLPPADPLSASSIIEATDRHKVDGEEEVAALV